MARLLIFGNFELTFDNLKEGENADELVREKEAEILRLLQRIAKRGDRGGKVETFEFESFIYSSGPFGEPDHYYYNKFEQEEQEKI